MLRKHISWLQLNYIIISILVIISILISNININSLNLSSSITHNSGQNSYTVSTFNGEEQLYQARSPRQGYTYHNYSTLVSDLNNLSSQYPSLIEVYTAQDAYELPDCAEGYKVWVIRITNEMRGFNKPEVLIISGHHGDEPISIEASYYLIEYLLQNYNSDPSIKYLLDHREIYVLPVINPWGWEHNVRYDFNGEDVNRDYPYGKEPGNTPLTTVGARAVAEMMKRHVFVLSLTWHSGNHLIYYAWGTPLHDTATDESPDNIAFFKVAELMSDSAGGGNKYPFGPANSIFSYSPYGAWSDYAYASTWDHQNVTAGYETVGGASLAFGIEISDIRKPDENLLGTADEVFNPGDTVDGFIPQNIRMALIMIDLAEPYLLWENKAIEKIPTEVIAGTNISLNWSVNGSVSITETQIQYGTNPNPSKDFTFKTASQSGTRTWPENTVFTEQITLPEVPGDYYFVAHAVVDQNSLQQTTPEPDVTPQSFFVQQRTNESYSVTINGNTLAGKKDWYSTTFHIKVKSPKSNRVWISNYDDLRFCNEPFNISWSVETDGIINYTELQWGPHYNPINHSTFQTDPLPIIPVSTTFNATITFPSRPGMYYFSVHLRLVPGSSATSKNTIDYWSEILSLEVKPKVPYRLEVSIPIIKYESGAKQSLALSDITCFNQTISDNHLNNSMMIRRLVSLLRFDPSTKTYLNTSLDNYNKIELEWSMDNGYWYLPDRNISAWPEGWYQVVSEFTHRYGQGQSNNSMDLSINNWFRIVHKIKVDTPESQLKIDDDIVKVLDISNVSCWSSNSLLGFLDGGEVNKSTFEIKNLTTDQIALTGDMLWSSTYNTWQALNIDISTLPQGSYYVICNFTVPDIGYGESIHINGDKSEFIFNPTRISDNNDDLDDDQNNLEGFNYYLLAGLVIGFVLIFLIFLILLFRIRQKH